VQDINLRSFTIIGVDILQGSKEMKAVFIWIPKTGGTTVTTALGLNQYIIGKTDVVAVKYNCTFGHAYLPSLKIPIEWENIYLFTFVRNPYGRIYSLYKYYQRAILPPFCENPPSNNFNEWLKQIPLNFISGPGDFNAFGWSQAAPQHKWIRNIPNVHIFKLENIYADLMKLGKLFERKMVVLPHLNKSGENDWQDHFNDESIKIVNDFYKKDFKLFGYEMI